MNFGKALFIVKVFDFAQTDTHISAGRQAPVFGFNFGLAYHFAQTFNVGVFSFRETALQPVCLFPEIFGFVQQSGFFFIRIAAQLLLQRFQLVEMNFQVQVFPIFIFIELLVFYCRSKSVEQLFDEFVLRFS